MSPLDRITQLTERAENSEKQCDIVQRICESAQREVALLRSQLSDARQQLERDSATIARLHARNGELDDLLTAAVFRMELEHESGSTVLRAWISDARAALSRHA